MEHGKKGQDTSVAENYEESGKDNEHCENCDKKRMAIEKCDFCFVKHSDETRKHLRDWTECETGRKERHYEVCVVAQCRKQFLCVICKVQLLLVFSVGSQNKLTVFFLLLYPSEHLKLYFLEFGGRYSDSLWAGRYDFKLRWRGRDFSAVVLACCDAHPSSCTMGTGALSHG